MTHEAATLDATPVVDRVRAAIAACPDGVRPATIEHALLLHGELRAITERLEESGEVEFDQGRLRPSTGDQAASRAYESMPPAARAQLHERLAEAIGRTSYEPGIAEFEQARHELRAGRRERAVERLTRVAEDATRAADHALVVRAIDELAGSDAPLDARLRELHARAAVESGDPRAADLWHAALAAWEQSGDEAGHATRAVVSWFWSNPDDPAAIERLSTAAQDAADGGGWARYAAAVRAIFDADWQGAIAPLEHALAAARDEGDRELEAAVLGSLATARSYLGQLDVAIELLRRSAPLAAASADAVTMRRIRHNLVETLVEALRTTEAIEEAHRFAADLQRLGARHYLPGALALEARVRALAADTAAARSLASRALADDRALAEPQRDVYVHMVAAELLAIGGDTDRFRGFVADVTDRCRDFGFDSWDAALDEVRARALLVSGDASALAHLLATTRDTEPTGLANLALAGGRARLELGDERLAAAHDELLERLQSLAEPAVRIPLVALAIREGRAIAARDAAELESIAAEWEVAGRPLDATLLRRAGRAATDDGVAAARDAALLESWGWSALAARPVGDAAGDGDQADPAALSITSIPLLSELPAGERAQVLATMTTFELQPPGGGDAEDEDRSRAPAGVSIVARGEVRLLRAEPGSTERRLVVAALGPGDVFGHESMLADEDAGALVEAAVESRLHVVPAAELAALVTRAPAFASALLADASERLAEARLLAGESALLPVETRLARTLVRLGDRFGRPSLRGELLLDTSLTHADLASMIGSQRARVSSLLSALHKAGVTDTWKRRIVVLDAAELRRRAGLAPASS